MADTIADAKELNLNYRGDAILYSFIINTLHSTEGHNKKVGHWISIAVEYIPHVSKVKLWYFDSFGEHYDKYKCILKYIDNMKHNCRKHRITFDIDYIRRGIQSFTSKLCGVYCAYFIVSLWENLLTRDNTLDKLFYKFKGNRKDNDSRIIRFLRRHWPFRSYCHNYPINDKRKLSMEDMKKIKPAPPPPFCLKQTLGEKCCMFHKECRCSRSTSGCCNNSLE